MPASIDGEKDKLHRHPTERVRARQRLFLLAADGDGLLLRLKRERHPASSRGLSFRAPAALGSAVGQTHRGLKQEPPKPCVRAGAWWNAADLLAEPG